MKQGGKTQHLRYKKLGRCTQTHTENYRELYYLQGDVTSYVVYVIPGLGETCKE